MSENAISQAFDAIHDEAVRLLRQNPPEPIEAGLRLIVSLARYKADVRNDGSNPEPGANLSLAEAYDMLASWTRSLLAVIQEHRAEIEEILTGTGELPKGCPSHGSLASLVFGDARKKFTEVKGMMEIVDRKIRHGGKE
jgi:hypothetical protein